MIKLETTRECHDVCLYLIYLSSSIYQNRDVSGPSGVSGNIWWPKFQGHFSNVTNVNWKRNKKNKIYEISWMNVEMSAYISLL